MSSQEKTKKRKATKNWSIIGVFALLITLIFVMMSGGSPSQSNPAYRVIQNPEVVRDLPADILVFFWYGCPSCWKAEEAITSFVRARPETKVVYRHSSVSKWESDARLFYAIQARNPVAAQRSIDDLMSLYPVGGWWPDSNKKASVTLDTLVAGHSISAAGLRLTIKSPVVDAELQKQRQIEQALQVRGVPYILVAGKYEILLQNIPGGWGGLPAVLNELLTQSPAP